MIDLRYHIVSIMAVFLALGLGILLGASVVNSPIQAQLNSDLGEARDERDSAREDEREAVGERTALQQLLGTEIAPWAISGRLDGARIVLVSDGSEIPEFRDHVASAFEDAGAEGAGTLVLESKWELQSEEDAEELTNAMQPVVPLDEIGDDLGANALRRLGEELVGPSGEALVEALSDAGFLSIQGRPDGSWPPPGSMIVILSHARTGEDVPTRGGTAFARAVASTDTPTLVVSDRPGGRSILSELRADEEDIPEALATFDAAPANGEDPSAPGRVGVVAALVAASEGRGDHFGSGDRLRFVAPAGPQG